MYSSSLCVWFALISLYTGEPLRNLEAWTNLCADLEGNASWVGIIPLNSWEAMMITTFEHLWTMLVVVPIHIGVSKFVLCESRHFKTCKDWSLWLYPHLSWITGMTTIFSYALQWCQETFGSSSCGHAGAKFWHHVLKVCEFSQNYVVIHCHWLWSVLITIGTHWYSLIITKNSTINICILNMYMCIYIYTYVY